MTIGFFLPLHSSLACTQAPVCTAPSTLAADGCSCTYALLTPLPGIGTTFDPTTAPGSTQNNNLGIYLNAMITIFIGICAILAVIMIVIGGMEYMGSELIASKEEGKERILHAIFGLLLALGAWTLLNQINPNILKSDLSSLSSVQVNVETQPDIPQTGTVVNGVTMYKINGTQYANGAGFLQIAGAPAQLPPNVTVCGTQTGCGINAQCVTVGQQGCTSTDGLNPTLVDSIANGCKNSDGTPCAITLTAGTESWLHGGTTGTTSHGPNSPTVDLAVTPALTAYLTGDTSTFPTGTTIVDAANKACYYAEPANATSSTTGAHWHVYAMSSSGTC